MAVYLSLCVLAGVISISHQEFPIKDLAILYDIDSFPSTHSVVLDLLKVCCSDYLPNGYDIGTLENQSFFLLKFDQLKYKNLILVSNKKKRWSLPLERVLEFADKGGNIFAVGGLESGLDFTNLVSESGFLVAGSGVVFDHANSVDSNDPPNSPKTVVISEEYTCKGRPIIETGMDPILFRGLGFGIDPSNPMTFTILSGSPDTYLHTAFKNKKTPLVSGTGVVLVGGVEMRNLGRIVIMGSLEAISDKAFFGVVPPNQDSRGNLRGHSSSGNVKFFTGLADWVFLRTGVLRVVDAHHRLVSSGLSLDQYVVETLIEYSIRVEEQTKNGNWKPFVAKDLQLEQIRLTTFGRVTYNVSRDGTYTARFYAPDFIGTYGLITRYKKIGYTTLDHQVKIIIRPRRHNDYDRFIRGAWPYYITAFLMMGMVYFLVFALLNQEHPKQKSE